ncbi:MAG TPA: hypothetical protein DCZ95_08450 [Verrucomicrobia bacterium]|nr:MAG: hypothetical protein A2X46_12485 [Lentisphaerae bacterium GWF2_57_35]HBA84108.1 hypothetical protein [Verrucomicrobiota bacterium]
MRLYRGGLKRSFFTASLIALTSIVLTQPSHAGNTYSGGLSNRFYRWTRPESVSSLSSVAPYFHTIKFNAGSAMGAVTVTASSPTFTPQLFLYQNSSFDPYNPLANLYAMGSGSVTAPNFAHGIAIDHLLVVSGFNDNDAGGYNVTITGPGTMTVNTNYDPTLSIMRHPEDPSIMAGQTAIMRVWASGRQPHAFQWYRGPRPANTNAIDPAMAIGGATNAVYTTPALMGSTSYWVLVSGIGTNKRSSQADVTVSIAPAAFSNSLTTQHDTWRRMSSLGVDSGQVPYFEVWPFRASVAGDYTFTLNTPSFPGAMNIYGPKFLPATPAVNFVDATVAGGSGLRQWTISLPSGDYELVVSSASSGQVGSYTGQITGASAVIMLPRPTVPVFLSTPGNRTTLTNTSVTLSFSVEGAIPRAYQWYRGEPPNVSQPIVNATNKSYTTPLLTSVTNYDYWARVNNSYGAATTDTVRVRVVTGSSTFGGVLRPGNKRWQRSNGSGGMVAAQTYYKTMAFEAPIIGTYTVKLTTAGFSGTVSLYNQIFNPANPNLNHTGTFETGNPVIGTVNVSFPAMYWIVMSTANQGATGSYTVAVSGPTLANELPAPTFTQQPTTNYQFLWRNEDPLPIVAKASESGTWSWYPGVTPGVPADGLAALAGFTGATVDLTAATTAATSNFWYWARMEGAYGYEDSALAMLEVCPPPRFATYPTTQTNVYGYALTNTALITNVPFIVKWFRGSPPDVSHPVATNLIQGYGAGYVRLTNVSGRLLPPVLNVGTYSFWLQATNPSGTTNGPAFTVVVSPRPLSFSNDIPVGVIYDKQPHSISSAAYDPVPGGPALPNPVPILITYKYASEPAATNQPVYAGAYTAVVSLVGMSNYVGGSTSTLAIAKKSLAVLPDNKYRVWRATNPPLTFGYAGFAAGDSAANLTAPPSAITSANTNSPWGQYPITLTAASDRNYAYDSKTGTLTVVGAPVVVAWQQPFSNAASDLLLMGSAALTNGVLRLTSTGASQFGMATLIAPEVPLNGLHAEFDLFIGGGTAANGFSFNYCGDAVTGALYAAEEGIGAGLSITVDTHDNGGELVPNIGVKYRGQFLSEIYCPAVRASAYRRMAFDVTSNGLVSLSHNAVTLIANLAVTNWAPMPEWKVRLAARSGAAGDAHLIDNLLVGERTAVGLVPPNAAAARISLPPAFGLPAGVATYSNTGNGNPALVSVAAAPFDNFRLAYAYDAGGSTWLTFRGTNGTMDAPTAFQLTTANPEIGGSIIISNGIPTFQINGMMEARYYLQSATNLLSPQWTTLTNGPLMADSNTTVRLERQDQNVRIYRVLVAP